MIPTLYDSIAPSLEVLALDPRLEVPKFSLLFWWYSRHWLSCLWWGLTCHWSICQFLLWCCLRNAHVFSFIESSNVLLWVCVPIFVARKHDFSCATGKTISYIYGSVTIFMDAGTRGIESLMGTLIEAISWVFVLLRGHLILNTRGCLHHYQNARENQRNRYILEL